MRRLRAFALAATVLLSAAACDSPTDPEVHAEGVVLLRANGSEAARFIYGQGVSGSGIEVEVGETVIVRVRALDEAGNSFAFGSDYTIRNPAVVTGLRASVAVQGGDQLIIQGLSAGAGTTLTFVVFHGLHEEFPVDGIPLRVTS